MKAAVRSRVVAESDDVVECQGYHYFPRSAVQLEWLEKTERTERDLECPHAVQFYDVVVDGARHPRAAGCYEAPRPEKAQTAERFGFWHGVTVG